MLVSYMLKVSSKTATSITKKLLDLGSTLLPFPSSSFGRNTAL